MDYITRIMANARTRLTGVVDDALRMGLFEAVDEFCRETDIWQEDIAFDTVTYTPDLVYDLVPTEGTILRLIALKVTGQTGSLNGTMRVPGELKISSMLNADVNVTATVSLSPIDPVEVGSEFPVIDAWIWQRHFTALTDGLIMKMASQVDKPYTSGTLVEYHGRRFRNAIGVARADNIKANLADGQAWQFPDFAAQRNSSTQVT